MAILICFTLELHTADLPTNQTDMNDQLTFAAVYRYLKKSQ